MTREQEIRQASIEYTIGNRPMCIGSGAFSEIADELNRNKSFEEGAKWADENPYLSEEEQVGFGGLGMIWQKQALIKKTCEWLDSVNTDYYMDSGIFQMNDLISDLRKYLEE
jgi:hypothetical protein